MLHDGNSEAGVQVIVFESASLSDGVYAVRIAGETFVATSHVMFVR